MAENGTKEPSVDESRVLGMTRSEIEAVADALTQQKDQNHPTKTGSYQELVKNARTGREALSEQNNYCQKKP
jgi:hypothetical protein